MLESFKSSKERWGGVSDIIDRWLNERQELILLYVAINGLDEFTPADTPVNIKVKAFCQVLVDYVSAGHFEVYEQLINEAKEFNDDEAVQLAEQLIPCIQAITEHALNFNDDYAKDEYSPAVMNNLPKALSGLGEQLEERFQIEDRLIEVLHTNHKTLVV